MRDDLRALLTAIAPTVAAEPDAWTLDEDGDACLVHDGWRLDVHRHEAAARWLVCASSAELPGLALNWTINQDEPRPHLIVSIMFGMLEVALRERLRILTGEAHGKVRDA